jgi:predicted outer membrane protein
MKASTQDVTWKTAKAQTALAEISLGTLVASKSTNADTLSLAKVTKSQHKLALAKLRTLAKSLHVTLPTSPNATQLKQANQLKKLSGMSFNRTYDYLPIAQMHLKMAQKLKTELAH